MIYIANYGSVITQAELNAIASFVALATTPAGNHLAKDGSGNFVNTPDTGGGGGAGGLTTQLQWNNTGVLDGITRATTDGTTVSFLANGILIKDQTDPTKIAAFDASAITTATTRTYILPDLSGTLVLTTGAQTLQSKTLDNSNIVTLRDDRFTLQDDGDATKQAVFQLSGITAGQTRTLTVPDASGTLTLLGNTTTGTGSIVLANTPTLVTPILGVATATSINGLTLTTSTGVITITNGKTLAVTNTLTFSGTDSTVMTFPTTSATIARTDAANTFIGASTASAWVLTSPTITTKLNPTTDDGAPLGDTTHNWSDLFLASGAVINFANGNVVLTQTSGVLTMGTGDLRITTAGTNSASVVTVGGTQTLTAKTLTSPVITTGSYSGAQQLQENASIALDPAGSADGKYSGITIAGTAGAALAFGDLIYLAVADSRWELADADSATTANMMMGMCVLAAAADGDPTVVLLMGNIRADTAFPTMTVGVRMYVGETAGDIQATIPTGADNIIRAVGYALTADELYFNPSMDSQATVA